MYFEDEKDIIDDSANLHVSEDGTVSWEEILSDTDDSGIEFVDDSEQEDLQPVSDVNSSNTGGDIEYVQDVEDAVSQKDTTTSSDSGLGANNYSSETYSPEENISDEFDIDKQLSQISGDGVSDDTEEFTMPAKATKKSNSSVVLLALLVAVLVMGGIYYYFTNFHNPNQQLVQESTKTRMDNTTSEDIEQRTADSDENEDNSEEANAPIPVVNDDNVDELKAEEVPQEDKKEIISITPTGRPNPFMPLQKYAQMDITETFVRYDKAGIPTPPLKMEKQDQNTVKMLTIAVSGIMYDKEKPSAIITLEDNDYFVQKGDKLDDYRIIDIGPNYVTMALGKNLYKANVGEEFKVSSNIYGSAKYIPQGQGGGRQYYSVSKDGGSSYGSSKKTATPGAPRYVSEDEVEIKTK